MTPIYTRANRTVWFLPGQISSLRNDLPQALNPFLYVSNSPTRGIDPMGLDKQKEKCEDTATRCSREMQRTTLELRGQNTATNTLPICSINQFNSFGDKCVGRPIRECYDSEVLDLSVECGQRQA